MNVYELSVKEKFKKKILFGQNWTISEITLCHGCICLYAHRTIKVDFLEFKLTTERNKIEIKF